MTKILEFPSFNSRYRKAQRAAQVLEFPASLRGNKATEAISMNSRIPQRDSLVKLGDDIVGNSKIP